MKKNIFLLETDKPNRLGKFIDTNNLFIRTPNDIPRGVNVELYITSDEEIISFNEINSLPLSDDKDIQTDMSNI